MDYKSETAKNPAFMQNFKKSSHLMQRKPPAIVIATPTHGMDVCTGYTISLLKFQAECIEKRIPVQVDFYSSSLVHMGRNVLTKRFLALEQATHLLFVDSDIQFDPSTVWRMLDFNQEVCGGVYPLKDIDWSKAPEYVKKGRTGQLLQASCCNYTVNFLDDKQLEINDDGFCEVMSIGMGLCLIKRNAFEKLEAHCPKSVANIYHKEGDENIIDRGEITRFFDFANDENGVQKGEDYSFCQEWRKIGGKVWADTQSELIHWGAMGYHGCVSSLFQLEGEGTEDGERWSKTPEELAAEQIKQRNKRLAETAEKKQD